MPSATALTPCRQDVQKDVNNASLKVVRGPSASVTELSDVPSTRNSNDRVLDTDCRCALIGCSHGGGVVADAAYTCSGTSGDSSDMPQQLLEQLELRQHCIRADRECVPSAAGDMWCTE